MTNTMNIDPQARIELLESALRNFAKAAEAGQNMQAALAGAGMLYSDQCIAYVWSAARHLSRHDFEYARTVLKGEA